MEEKEMKSATCLLRENKQPIKSVTKQDIDKLKNSLEQLTSWKEPLKLVNGFFENQTIPLNKKKIMRGFHAQAKVFNLFYRNFQLSMTDLEEQVTELERKEKIRMLENQYCNTDFLGE